MPRSAVLEVIVSSLDDALAAAGSGAQRFELCSALALGGLTPSLGTLRAVKRETQVPVMCMIRPREGGMAYSEKEFSTMLEDLELVLEEGADGIVFGFLTADGRVDLPRCRTFLDRIAASRRPVQTVFHRAFDVTADPDGALLQLIDLGVTRVLTSGRAPRAIDGAGEIRRMVELADGRIEILPGGGIWLDQVGEILERTGAGQVHIYLTRPRQDRSTLANPAVSFGAYVPSSEIEYRAVDGQLVRQARERMDKLS